jgi:hypothetical protein
MFLTKKQLREERLRKAAEYAASAAVTLISTGTIFILLFWG